MTKKYTSRILFTGVKYNQQIMRIKKLFLISLFIFVSFASSFAQERVHADEYYCLTGPVRLRNEMSFSEDALVHTTLNHEGGLAFKILKTGKREKGEYSEGIWLYVILTLCNKTQKEIAQDSEIIGGTISIGGASSSVVAQATSQIAEKYPDIKFQFFNGDAEFLMEKLDHGTLDFGILIEPVDISKYDHLPLKETDEWGLLMKKDCTLASKKFIQREDIKNIPLILPQRRGLQRELAVWAGIDVEDMNLIATFDILFNNPSLLIKKGLGYAFSLRTLVDTSENSSLCFRPLEPSIKIQYGIAWKRHQIFSKASQKFLDQLKILVNKTL